MLIDAETRIQDLERKVRQLEKEHTKLKNTVNGRYKVGRPATKLELAKEFLRQRLTPGEMIEVWKLEEEFPYSMQVLRKARKEVGGKIVWCGGKTFWRIFTEEERWC